MLRAYLVADEIIASNMLLPVDDYCKYFELIPTDQSKDNKGNYMIIGLKFIALGGNKLKGNSELPPNYRKERTASLYVP